MLHISSRNGSPWKYLLGSAPSQQQGTGLFRVLMEGERTSGGFVLNLLGDMERLSLGSAAGTEPLVLEEKLLG